MVVVVDDGHVVANSTVEVFDAGNALVAVDVGGSRIGCWQMDGG